MFLFYLSIGLLISIIMIFGYKLSVMAIEYFIYAHKTKEYHELLLPIQVVMFLLIEYDYITMIYDNEYNLIMCGHLSAALNTYYNIIIYFSVVNMVTYILAKKYEESF